jgi:hypothetical protein
MKYVPDRQWKGENEVNIKEVRDKLNVMVNDRHNIPEILRFFPFR